MLEDLFIGDQPASGPVGCHSALSGAGDGILQRESQRHLSCDAHHKEFFRYDGADRMSTLTHRLEDLFVVFREDPSGFPVMNRETFDLIFEATDFIRKN